MADAAQETTNWAAVEKYGHDPAKVPAALKTQKSAKRVALEARTRPQIAALQQERAEARAWEAEKLAMRAARYGKN